MTTHGGSGNQPVVECNKEQVLLCMQEILFTCRLIFKEGFPSLRSWPLALSVLKWLEARDNTETISADQTPMLTACKHKCTQIQASTNTHEHNPTHTHRSDGKDKILSFTALCFNFITHSVAESQCLQKCLPS